MPREEVELSDKKLTNVHIERGKAEQSLPKQKSSNTNNQDRGLEELLLHTVLRTRASNTVREV